MVLGISVLPLHAMWSPWARLWIETTREHAVLRSRVRVLNCGCKPIIYCRVITHWSIVLLSRSSIQRARYHDSAVQSLENPVFQKWKTPALGKGLCEWASIWLAGNNTCHWESETKPKRHRVLREMSSLKGLEQLPNKALMVWRYIYR